MARPVEDHPVLLEVSNLTKRFPGVVALDSVSIEVREREVLGLIGQNGSGKSTLLKILAGVYQPDEGTIVFRGEQRRLRSIRDARLAGIGMVFQEQSLLPNLTVAENILLGVEGDAARGGLFRWSRVRSSARRQLEKLDLPIPLGARIDALSFAQRQMVELAKALVTEDIVHSCPLILFDEPTSTLSHEEAEVLFAQIERLRSRTSIVFVSHRLEEILRLADRVYVLKDGKRIAERRKGAWSKEEFFTLMVGEEASEDYYRTAERVPFSADHIRLLVRDLSGQSFRDVGFSAHAGEIVGICGLEGSGRESLLRTLFGVESATAGEVSLDGRIVDFDSPAEAVHAEWGYIPADRSAEAVLADLSVLHNMSIARLDQVRSGPFLALSKEHAVGGEWIERLNIRTPSDSTMLKSLSGGNQQKVVFARWMLSPDLKVLLLDHPTRGLDVGAKMDIYRLIRRLAAAGTTILLISDSLEETIALSHAVLVMRDGVISGRFDAVEVKPSEDEIIKQMM
ncbi:MAG: sugar ABC transporter ATP-binding protein [Actinomycetota bacterium]